MIKQFYGKNNKLILLSSLFFLFITNLCVSKNITNQYVFIIWLLSIYLIIKFFGITFKKQAISSVFKFFKSKSFIFLSILYFIPRLILLCVAPNLRMHHDETILAYNAYDFFVRAINEHSLNMLGSARAPVSVFPSIWYCLQGAILYFLGYNFYTAKIFSLITDFCIFSCLWFYGIRFLNNKIISFISCFIYATFFPAIYYSNVILNNIQSSLFCFVILILLIISNEKSSESVKNNKSYLIIGLIAGFSLYFYLSSIALPFYIAFFVLYCLCLKVTKLKDVFLKCNYFLCGYIFSSLPFWCYSYFYESFLGGRADTVGVLKYYKEDFFGFLKLQLINIILGFYNKPFNGSGMHYLDISLFDGKFLLVMFLMGFFITFFYTKRKEIFIFQIFFIITMLLGGLFTNDPPASQRLLPILWIIPFFCAISIYKICKFLKRYVIKKKHVSFLLTSIALLIAVFECNLTFKKAIIISKSARDLVLGFIPVYKNEKLPVYGVIPDHASPMLSFYLEDPEFKVHSLYEVNERENFLKDNKPHYVLYFIQDTSNIIDFKKLDSDDKYEKVNMLNPDGLNSNGLYRCYKLKSK